MNAAIKYDTLDWAQDEFDFGETMDSEILHLKSVYDLSVGELMDYYYDVSISKSYDDHHFNLQIDNDDFQTIIDKKEIRRDSLEGFAEFARRFLKSYDRLTNKGVVA